QRSLLVSGPPVCGLEIESCFEDLPRHSWHGTAQSAACSPLLRHALCVPVPVSFHSLGARGWPATGCCALFGFPVPLTTLGCVFTLNDISRKYREEEQNRGKPNWEHLNEDLHVLITVEDAQNRAEIKLKRAVEEVKKLLVPAVTALAFSLAATAQAAPRIITGPAPVLPPAALRTPTPAGPTIMPLIRQIQTAVMPNGTPHPTAAIVPPGPEAGLIYTPYEYPYTLAPATSILEYPIEPSGVLEWIEMPVMPDISAH
ncbi:hypothetical protein FD754_007908, partial [Muntiacus muntjak]